MTGDPPSPPAPTPAGPSAWQHRQDEFVARLGDATLDDLERWTIVVVPSATFPVVELNKIAGIQHYEERLLYSLLLLRHPETRIVYPTSLAVDGAIVEYYLGFLDDPAGAGARCTMLALDDDSVVPLTEKLLARPDAIERVREAVGDTERAYMLPYNVTPAEQALSDALGLAMYGTRPDLVWLGSKTGARRVARRAGVPVFEGDEGLSNLEEVERAVRAVAGRRAGAEAVVIKLNDGFSGQGNALVDLATLGATLVESPTTFCAANESWSSFSAKIAAGGAVVEELARGAGLTSPSAQVRISPNASFEVISTHDQVLGGPDNQVYLGCRFPAAERYRERISAEAEKVAGVLAAEGVIGSFGVDFVVLPGPAGDQVVLSEINLRMGGTTHPYWMTRLATGGHYERERGELLVGGEPRAYVASDNIKSQRLVGRKPGEVIAAVERAGLAYDRARASGAALHLLGALPGFGKMGATCIAGSREEADALYSELVGVLTG